MLVAIAAIFMVHLGRNEMTRKWQFYTVMLTVIFPCLQNYLKMYSRALFTDLMAPFRRYKTSNEVLKFYKMQNNGTCL